MITRLFVVVIVILSFFFAIVFHHLLVLSPLSSLPHFSTSPSSIIVRCDPSHQQQPNQPNQHQTNSMADEDMGICQSSKPSDEAPQPEENSEARVGDDDMKSEPTQRLRAAVIGPFAADSFSLGYHWVYNTADIPHPVPSELRDPASQFHAGKKRAQLTHEGDQGLLVLRSLVENRKFELKDYAHRFQNLFDDTYKGWFTHAVKHVLSELGKGTSPNDAGSAQDDLSPVGRVAPFLLVYEDQDELIKAARKYVKFTHNDAYTLKITEFFLRVTRLILNEHKSPSQAITEVAALPAFAADQAFQQALKAGRDSKDEDTLATIKKFGQACSSNSGLPGVFHLLAKYENDFGAAMEANVGAGGDSSARGTIVGMVLGAHLGVEGLPGYTTDMRDYADISALIESVEGEKVKVAEEQRKKAEKDAADRRTRISSMIN